MTQWHHFRTRCIMGSNLSSVTWQARIWGTFLNLLELLSPYLKIEAQSLRMLRLFWDYSMSSSIKRLVKYMAQSWHSYMGSFLYSAKLRWVESLFCVKSYGRHWAQKTWAILPRNLLILKKSQGTLDFLKLNEDKCFVQCIVNIQWHMTNLYFSKAKQPGVKYTMVTEQSMSSKPLTQAKASSPTAPVQNNTALFFCTFSIDSTHFFVM